MLMYSTNKVTEVLVNIQKSKHEEVRQGTIKETVKKRIRYTVIAIDGVEMYNEIYLRCKTFNKTEKT